MFVILVLPVTLFVQKTQVLSFKFRAETLKDRDPETDSVTREEESKKTYIIQPRVH